MGLKNGPKNTGQNNLEQKTLDELRALARTAGLQGYSSLRKKQLIELLGKSKARSSESKGKDIAELRSAPKKTTKSKSTSPASATRTKSGAQPAAPIPTPAAEEPGSDEERIEKAKFETTLPGIVAVPRPAVTRDLQEDIDRLPMPSEPILVLLPQKPGVVHAYWSLETGAETKHLRLRLCRITDTAIELLEEVKVTAEHGHWYFQLSDMENPGALFAQLGQYDASGQFKSAIRRSVARIPTLYASSQTDRRWWIGEEEFREMYQRAGGVVRAAKFTWPGSFSSRHK